MLNNICASSWKHHKKILQTTELLSHRFGITYFGIQRITTEGYWSLVTNNPKWVEHCANEKFYLHDPTLVKPDHYQAGISFISAHPDPEFRNSLLKSAADQFDMDHCLAIVDDANHDREFIFFATSFRNKNIINTYITQFKQLQRFVDYFKSENKQALQDAEAHSVDLKRLKNQAYFANENILNCLPNYANAQLDTLLYNLSDREEQCLRLLLKGKTAKEIAKKLSLSHRTVEEYIANLKKKTNCHHLYDLFVLFNDRL